MTTIVSSSQLDLTRRLKPGRITENLLQSDEVEQEVKILDVTSEQKTVLAKRDHLRKNIIVQ